MIEISGLFESHLTVSDLERSIHFYRDKLGLVLAHRVRERRAAFFWIGAPGKTMLGLWESGSGPNRMRLHIAFDVTLEQILEASAALRRAGIVPLDFNGEVSVEPQVLAWMPAASIYFRDPDGHMLEFLAMLDGEVPAPSLGVVNWSEWRR